MIQNDSVTQDKYQQFIEPLMEKMDLVFIDNEPADLIDNLWECLMIRSDPDRTGSDYVYSVREHLIALIEAAEGLVVHDSREGLRVHDTDVQAVFNTAVAPGRDKMKLTNPAVLQLARLSAVNYVDYLDPYRVLHKFFKEQPKALWVTQVNYWCGQKDLPPLAPELSVATMMARFKTLAKLIEACYLLAEIEWNGNINTPIDYFFQAEYMPASIPVEDMLNPYEAVCYCFMSQGAENLLQGLSQWERAVLNKADIWEINPGRLRLVHAIQYIVEFAYVLTAIPYLKRSWLDVRSWTIDLTPGLPAVPELLSGYAVDDLEDPFKLLSKLEPPVPGAFRELSFEWLMVAASPERNKPEAGAKFARIRQSIEVMLAATAFVVRKRSGDWLPDIVGADFDNDFLEDC